MTNSGWLDVKVYKNNAILKNITEPIRLNSKNWTGYLNTVRNVQKNVNVYLTELVEQEKSGEEQVNLEESEESDDELDESDPVKRKVHTLDDKNVKKRKL